jgi:chaperonin GroES
MNLQPLEDRVLIEPSEDSEQKTPGGIIIPDTAKEKPRMGVVKSVGTDEALQKIVKAGDKVLYGKYSGDEIEMAGKKYLIVKKEDILAIVK